MGLIVLRIYMKNEKDYTYSTHNIQYIYNTSIYDYTTYGMPEGLNEGVIVGATAESTE